MNQAFIEIRPALPHGVRARYCAGCRCERCRQANTAYERERGLARRRGDWNGIVAAGPAREHMKQLARAGVGIRAIAASTDLSRSILQEIRKGDRPQIRGRTARKILAVTAKCRSDRAHVSAKRLWLQINKLLEEGYTRKQLADHLGVTKIQFDKDRVTAANAHRVDVLYRRLTQ